MFFGSKRIYPADFIVLSLFVQKNLTRILQVLLKCYNLTMILLSSQRNFHVLCQIITLGCF